MATIRYRTMLIIIIDKLVCHDLLQMWSGRKFASRRLALWYREAETRRENINVLYYIILNQ